MTTTITPAQCRAARGLLALTQAEFAAVAKVNLETLRDFEAGRDQHTRSQFTGDGVRWAPPS
jgi:DNA-binding transcriptional regulator YiaG